jgi:hypothetical protein
MHRLDVTNKNMKTLACEVRESLLSTRRLILVKKIPVTTAWRLLGMRMERTASRHGG